MKNNKKIRQILDEVVREIQPDKNYEKEIFTRINSIIKKINKNQKYIKAILGGSGEKGTWLKTFDADIFVLFDYKKFNDKNENLSDILEKILRKRFKRITRLHGSRDYFQIKQSKFTFEIVPILKIKKAEQAKNITDVSPLHSRWVLKSAKIKDFWDTTKSKILCAENHNVFSRTKNAKRFLVYKKLVNEMKLTKQFCQAQNVYGAESYIRGFSGYTCEILTIYYGSFLDLIKNAEKWQDKAVIDVEKHYKGKDIFKILNTSKLISPLIVIDPVQKDRNAAAALSIEKFRTFKTAAREFLRNPSKYFFVKKDLKLIFMNKKSKNNKLILVKAKPSSGKIDVIGCKLLKIYEFLKEELKKHGFDTIKTDWEWNKKTDALFYFLFNKESLPKNIVIEGPPLKIKQHIDNFKKVHKNTFIKNNRIFALEKRRFLEPENLMISVAKNKFIMDRCKSIKINTI